MKLIKFYATWCSPCTTLSKLLEENSVPHESVDIDQELELVSKYNIRGIPTLIMLDEQGNVVDRLNGSINKTKLQDFLNSKGTKWHLFKN